MDRIKTIVAVIHAARQRVIRLNFYRCHMAYFVFVILICSIVLYGSNTGPVGEAGHYEIRYIDAFFLAASSMTTTGLGNINLNSLNGYQQSVVFITMILGDLSTVSISVVVVRRWTFRRQLSQKVRQSATARKVLEDIDKEQVLQRHPYHKAIHRRVRQNREENRDKRRAQDHPSTKSTALELRPYQQRFGGISTPWETTVWRSIVLKLSQWARKSDLTPGHHHYLSFEPHLDGRGRFRNLTSSEYEELGGVEYRALKLLSWILPTYTAFWILLAMVILAPYASQYQPVATTISDSQEGNLSPGWWGVFTALSSYTNSGLDLLSASMVPFQSNWLILIVTGGASVAGNTFYPIFLRCYIWILWKLVPRPSEIHHSLSFLLHHPRRCYLWLFDKKTTLVLAATQFSLIAVEWVLFEILNIHQTAVWALPTGTRTMDGLYQSLGTRSSGFYIVTMSSIAPALQIVYLIVMYFSVFPLLVSLRNTNVYEERSVGLDAEEYRAEEALENKRQRQSQGGALNGVHIRNQLAYDLWWIALSWILICIIEEPQLNGSAPGYSNFSILFEVVSAYGNCGLSLGVPYDYYSLCGTFHTLSKLILVTVMLRGRHRILPLAIDRSIMIPGESTMAALDREYLGNIDGSYEAIHRIREAESGRQAEDPEGRQDPESTNATGVSVGGIHGTVSNS
ncbi:cation transport protein-domain-containing protein [Whalleya microplaca]|nr:cation transport protein-domain-containing protein [Whalleya microplaca]